MSDIIGHSGDHELHVETSVRRGFTGRKRVATASRAEENKRKRSTLGLILLYLFLEEM
jgi:hypothetical protein